MEFRAATPDLDLELITVHGEELSLPPKISMTGKNAIGVIKKFQKLEEGIAEKDTTGIDIMAEELALVYDKNADWWLDNFDIETLKEILKHVANTIAGVKKKLKS